jgi:superfamily II DNA/RNA helicase
MLILQCVWLRGTGNVLFTDVRNVVVDEADTMFDAGFGEELEKLFLPIKVIDFFLLH